MNSQKHMVTADERGGEGVHPWGCAHVYVSPVRDFEEFKYTMNECVIK